MTLHVSAAKEVMNPYEWLPSYGESEVNFHSDRSDVIVEIVYRSDTGDAERVRRKLRFFGVCDFCTSAFPGAAGFTDVSYDTKWAIGSLIEFEKSDVAFAWSAHFSNGISAKHYLMQFVSENVQFQVVATGYALSEESKV
jgi:hypothetical protein